MLTISLKFEQFQLIPLKKPPHKFNNLQIQVQSRKNVLLRADRVLVLAAHHQLRVVHQINGEYQRAQRGVHQGHDAARYENRNNPEQQQHQNGHKEHTAHHGEIPLGLEREQRQAQTNGGRDANGQKHFHRLEIGRQGAQQERLGQRE
jgi:hypothetical protein